MNNTTAAMPPRLLKPKEAARYLAISERTLWSLTNAGTIPPVKLARAVGYDVRDLDAFIEAAKTLRDV